VKQSDEVTVNGIVKNPSSSPPKLDSIIQNGTSVKSGPSLRNGNDSDSDFEVKFDDYMKAEANGLVNGINDEFTNSKGMKENFSNSKVSITEVPPSKESFKSQIKDVLSKIKPSCKVQISLAPSQSVKNETSKNVIPSKSAGKAQSQTAMPLKPIKNGQSKGTKSGSETSNENFKNKNITERPEKEKKSEKNTKEKTASAKEAPIKSPPSITKIKAKSKARRSKGARVPRYDFSESLVIPNRRKSERTFDGDKLFGCNHCPLAFSNLESRVEHERTHLEKPYECPYCEMRFLAVISMNRHMRIHK